MKLEQVIKKLKKLDINYLFRNHWGTICVYTFQPNLIDGDFGICAKSGYNTLPDNIDLFPKIQVGELWKYDPDTGELVEKI